MTEPKKKRIGFAAMDPKLQRELASRGGKSSAARGTSHRWTSEEARIAGAKGGKTSRGGKGKIDPAEQAREDAFRARQLTLPHTDAPKG